MYKEIEKVYSNYCKARKLNESQSKSQTWGKDVMIEFAEQVILQLNIGGVSKRRELLNAFMKHIEKGGAIKFRDYAYSVKNFEEENKSIL